MATSQGSKYIFGSPATLALYDSDGSVVLTGYVSPDMESYDDRLTLTVNFIPANTTSVANALLSAQLPNVNGTCVITGAPVIRAGKFTDSINAPGAGSPTPGGRWIYAGGGSIKTTATGKATGTLTLKRYTNISVTGTATAL